MKSKFVRNPFARKFVAKALGASMAAGLAFATVVPAQAGSASYLNPPTFVGSGEYIPYFVESGGSKGPYVENSQGVSSMATAFTIEAKTADLGWVKGGWVECGDW